MDKMALEQRKAAIKEKMIASFGGFRSMKEYGKAKSITRQAVQQQFARFNVLEEWKSHVASQYNRFYFNAPKISCVYALFFKEFPDKKYYGSTLNLKKRLHYHFSALITNKHQPKLQNDFNEYGASSLKYEIIKEVPIKYLLIEEKKLIENNNCYNEKLPFNTPIEHLKHLENGKKRQLDKTRNLPRFKSKYKYVVWFWPAQLWKAQPSIRTDYGKIKQVAAGYSKTEEGAKKLIDDFYKINLYP
jgi:hypothetical protein